MAYQRRLETLGHHFDPLSECRSTPMVWRRTSSSRRADPVVIGGMVLDIQATSAGHEIRPGTTTPGEVSYVRGGVARNVAECLAKLDAQPFLISVVGDDMTGKILLEHWQSLGLSVDGIRICHGTSTPVISAVFDERGELAAAVADTRAVEAFLTPKWIQGFAREIQSASVVLIDANLNPVAIESACKLARNAGVPLWFEPVSVAKSIRATEMLSVITFISPNEAELVAMANAVCLDTSTSKPAKYLITISDHDETGQNPAFAVVLELEESIRKLLEAGVKYIVLTLGSKGAVFCSTELSGKISYHHYPAPPASIVKLSGAGDSLVAGALAALSKNLTEVQALAYGVAAAKLTVESEFNVAQNLSWAAISGYAEELLLHSQGFTTSK